MSKRREEENYFDDMWEEYTRPDPKKDPYKNESEQKAEDELLAYFDSVSGTDGQKRTGKKRRTLSKKSGPGIAAAILIMLLLGGVLGGFFSETKADPLPNGPVIQKPAETFAPPDVIPEATAPWSTEAPAATYPMPTAEPEITPVQRENYRYFARQLTDRQLKVYDVVREGLYGRADTIGPFSVDSEADLSLIMQAVRYDYPEYFWFRGGYSGSYYNRDTYLEYTLTPEYCFNAQEYVAYAAFVESAAQPVIDALSGKSDYEKVKGVYEYLVDNTIYDLAYTGTTIYEMFHDRRGVCEGYARAAQYLLTKLGVETLYAVGSGGAYGESRAFWGSHAWNYVKIDGIYYQMDVTWGDPVNDDGTQEKNMYYLNLTDEEMLRRHDREDWASYPVCSETYHNYYVYEGYYLEYFSKDIIEAWFLEAYNQGKPLEFKCANESIYRQAYSWLIENGGFGDLYSSVSSYGTYWYNNADDLYVLGTYK